jgi:thiol-disulfide isomerase/thioredoxin
MIQRAHLERAHLAQQYLLLFKPGDWEGANLLDLGRLFVLAHKPEDAKDIVEAYLRRLPASTDKTDAFKLLIWSLVEMKRWDEALEISEHLLDISIYDREVNIQIQALISGLRTIDPVKAALIAERRFPLLNQLNLGSTDQAVFIAERAEELGELYLEAGDAAKAVAFLANELRRIDVTPGASDELRLAQKLIAGAARRAQLRGKPAPKLTGTEYIDTKPFELAAWRGKVILIDFFEHSCGPCVADLPKIDALHDKYSRQGLEVIVVTAYRGYFGPRENITLSEELSALKNLKKERKTRVGFLIGPSTNFHDYGIFTLPAAALVDREGNVLFVKRYPETEELEEAIKRLLAEPAQK